MGEVYLAEHQLLKRPCAIKLIRPGKARDPRASRASSAKFAATAKLSHWNTVEIFDYGSTEDGTFYYVMEYLPGLSLAELVERFGPLPPERVIYLLTQTCDALREAHSLGLIHRDLKPGNIFAAHRGGVYDVAKLLDFGLAKLAVDMPSAQLTQEGMITGSPLYMATEQALGESEPDVRTDIYSLGAVMYFLLTGRPPFDNDNPMKVLVAHAHDEVAPPSTLRPDIPADLEQIVLRCLAKKPGQRFLSAASLGTALSECESAGLWSANRRPIGGHTSASRQWPQRVNSCASAAGGRWLRQCPVLLADALAKPVAPRFAQNNTLIATQLLTKPTCASNWVTDPACAFVEAARCSRLRPSVGPAPACAEKNPKRFRPIWSAAKAKPPLNAASPCGRQLPTMRNKPSPWTRSPPAVRSMPRSWRVFSSADFNSRSGGRCWIMAWVSTLIVTIISCIPATRRSSRALPATAAFAQYLSIRRAGRPAAGRKPGDSHRVDRPRCLPTQHHKQCAFNLYAAAMLQNPLPRLCEAFGDRRAPRPPAILAAGSRSRRCGGSGASAESVYR